MFQWGVVSNNSTYTCWIYPCQFSKNVFGAIYSKGVINSNWDSANYMDDCKVDYVRLNQLNCFTNNLGKEMKTLSGFLLVWGF